MTTDTIASYSWLLIPSRIQDPTKKKAIVDFLTWSLTEGQKMASAVVYARVPAPIASKKLAAIAKIQ